MGKRSLAKLKAAASSCRRQPHPPGDARPQRATETAESCSPGVPEGPRARAPGAGGAGGGRRPPGVALSAQPLHPALVPRLGFLLAVAKETKPRLEQNKKPSPHMCNTNILIQCGGMRGL